MNNKLTPLALLIGWSIAMCLTQCSQHDLPPPQHAMQCLGEIALLSASLHECAELPEEELAVCALEALTVYDSGELCGMGGHPP